MLSQPDCAAIVKSVIGLAQDLQIGVVAEGVETADQLEYLRQTSCDEVQGYIGRPMSASEITALSITSTALGARGVALIGCRDRSSL